MLAQGQSEDNGGILVESTASKATAETAQTGDLGQLRGDAVWVDSLDHQEMAVSVGAIGSAARSRFLRQHGPEARIPRSQSMPKEIRKALLAAEMDYWNAYGFHGG